MAALISLAIVTIILALSELFWRKKNANTETSRKFVHIVVGTYVAFWPFYLSWDTIRLISVLFLVGVLLSKTLNIFASIHEVERFSLGEVCFALAVGALTLITKNDYIYLACLLQMSLADGLAGLVGTHYGKKTSYKVFGANKSIVGTVTFLISSLLILLTSSGLGHLHFSLVELLVVSLAATLIENLAIYGLDDLLLPIAVGLILIHW